MKLCNHWRCTVFSKGATEIVYPLETLRSPIEVGVSAAGIVVPLLAALIAYLATKAVPLSSLAPLAASLFFFVTAVLIGLFNLFSMTASTNDEVTIRKDRLLYVIPVFVLQFLFFAAAMLILLIYFVTSFRLPPDDAAASAAASHTSWTAAPQMVAEPETDRYVRAPGCNGAENVWNLTEGIH